jgi:hypothetical protein
MRRYRGNKCGGEQHCSVVGFVISYVCISVSAARSLINEAVPIFVKEKGHFIRGNIRILIKDRKDLLVRNIKILLIEVKGGKFYHSRFVIF